MKELYPNGRVENLAIRKRPFLAKLKKRDGFYGDQAIIPVITGFGGGRSATASVSFGSSGTSTGSSKYKFVVTRAKDYNSVQLDGELIHASAEAMGAYIPAMRLEMDQKIEALGASLNHALWRNGGGAIGRVASVSGETFTLTNTGDAKHFFIGMTVGGSLADGTSGSVYTGTSVVTAVNPGTGVITLEDLSDINDPTGLAANDYVFAAGDFGAKVKGVSAWIPAADPTGTDLFSVNRSLDPVRLAGHRQSLTNVSIEENALRMGQRVFEYGGCPDQLWLSPTNFTKLILGRESKVVTTPGGSGNIGFKGFPIDYAGGTMMAHADPDCPEDAGFVLQSDTWEFFHRKGVPHCVDDDGLRVMRMQNEDSVEARFRYMGQLICRAPGWNGRFAI